MYKPDECEVHEVDLNDVYLGYEATLSHRITQEDLNCFACLVGDFNPLHMDEEYARTSSFGRPVVHGMLTASFISAMIGMVLPGKGALWTEQSLRFLNPAFVGDEIRVNARVTQVSQSLQTLVADITVKNQRDISLIEGKATVRTTKTAEEQEEGDRPGLSSQARDKRGVGARSQSPELADVGVVLITGGSGGIGAACARKLAQAGKPVAVQYNSQQEVAENLVDNIVADGGNAIAVGADLSLDDDIGNMFDEIERSIGPVCGIVHCAASEPSPTSIEEVDASHFKEVFNVQVAGFVSCLNRAMPNLSENESACIVLIGSIYGDGKPPLQQSAYTTAKAALDGLGRSLAVELGPKGIRVNTVAPGITLTKMTANLPQKAKLLARMNTPLRRLAEPKDIANAVEFLMSDNASHITGETLHVSGGA